MRNSNPIQTYLTDPSDLKLHPENPRGAINPQPDFSGQSMLVPNDITYLENILLDDSGKLQPVPYDQIRSVPQNDISVFCHKHGVYQIVTTELVEFVRAAIGFWNAVEIGSGNGCLGRALGIPMTDSFAQQTDKTLLDFYRRTGQPPVRYGADVRKLDALKAVKLLKAPVAVGSWVTHKKKAHLPDGFYGGVDEAILSKRLKRYIFIGNEIVHRNKELLRYAEPVAYKADWLVSRSMSRSSNVVWIFDFERGGEA